MKLSSTLLVVLCWLGLFANSNWSVAQTPATILTGNWVDQGDQSIVIIQTENQIAVEAKSPELRRWWDSGQGTFSGNRIELTHKKADVATSTEKGTVSEDGWRIEWDNGTHWVRQSATMPITEPGPSDNLTGKTLPKVDYAVVINTSDVADAGTDSNVYLTIHGEKGSTDEQRLNGLISGNAFERGNSDNCTLTGLPDVGTITSVTVRKEGDSDTGADWHLRSVSIGRVDGTDVTFTDGWWFTADSTTRTINPSKVRDYSVTIHTMDLADAGTDANIFLTINGKNGIMGRQRLNGLISGDAFERGQTDHCKLTGVTDVGDITSIRIESDNSGFGPGWCLEKVEISTGRKKYFFHLQQWIDSDSSLSVLLEPRR